MEISPRDVIEVLGGVFLLGGVWRDVRATQNTVKSLKNMLIKDHQVIVTMATTHNMNHPDAKVPLPEAYTNGNG